MSGISTVARTVTLVGASGGDNNGGGNGGNNTSGLFAKAPPILPTDISVDLSTTQGATVLDRAIAFINANPGTYTLLLDEDLDVGLASPRMMNVDGVHLTIIGVGTERRIRLISTGVQIISVGRVMVQESSDISLTIDGNITLVGHSGNSLNALTVNNGATLIMQGNSTVMGNGGGGVFMGGGLSGGGTTFIMRDNASVRDNGNLRIHGAGVFVDETATFYMYDNASVSGNRTTNLGMGGGVYVHGTFNMRGGTVSGNTAAQGGGVYLHGQGTFIMSAGTVYGADEPASLANSASIGAALARASSTAVARFGDGTNILTGGNSANGTIVGR